MTYANQLASYGGAVPEVGNPAATEAWALTEAARRMAAAMRGEKLEMNAALRLNWQLWTIIQAELTTETTDSNMTMEVRVNMLSLCQFIDHHTVDALIEPTVEKLQVLVNINRNIAAGLLESAQKAAPAPAAPVAADSVQASVALGRGVQV